MTIDRDGRPTADERTGFLHDTWSRKRLSGLGLAATLLAPGCRCSSEPTSVPAVAVAEVKSPDCVRSGVILTLAPSDRERQAGEARLDPSVELPFATEPGMAVALRGAFFATGLRHESRGAVALLGRVGAEDAPTQLVELGLVRGDVVPPRLAGDGGDLWVVLQDGTPKGRELRVARLAGGELTAGASWRPGPEQTNAESSSFDIAARAGDAMLVYDDWSAVDHHGRIMAAPILATAEAGRIEGKPVSLPGVDAEAPRIAARPGGYWIAWLVNAAGAGSGRVYDPGDEVGENAAPGSAYGARWLAFAALDARGKLVGDARRLTARQGRVVGYDLALGPSGSAWIVWRQDAPTPGASGGRIAMAELWVDSSPSIRSLRDEDVGAGEPTWLVASDGAVRWLSFPDSRDQTVLLGVESLGKTGASLRLGPELEGAGALAAQGEQLLFAVPRGRAVELAPAICTDREGPGGSGDAGVGVTADQLAGRDAGPPPRGPAPR
jgi:hypothetical protein